MSLLPFLLRYPRVFLLTAAVGWVAIYTALLPWATWLTGRLPPTADPSAVEALRFFLYDAPKVFLLLGGIVMAMGILNTYFTPERTRALLAGRAGALGNVLAACLGVVTPFCSCSAVPLFIGFLQAGVPLGVTFSFLIAAPMVNEIALALLFGLLGWKVALYYLAFGVALATVAGWIIGRLRLEHLIEDWVRALPVESAPARIAARSFGERILAAWATLRDILVRVWIYILLGIAVGALIHGYVPQAYLAQVMNDEAWWSVPLAILIGIPLYSNAAGIVPIIEVLLAKGAALGTVLAFMMSVIGLSLPELIILRKVLKIRLLLVFVGILFSGILLIGLLFNQLL